MPESEVPEPLAAKSVSRDQARASASARQKPGVLLLRLLASLVDAPMLVLLLSLAMVLHSERPGNLAPLLVTGWFLLEALWGRSPGKLLTGLSTAGPWPRLLLRSLIKWGLLLAAFGLLRLEALPAAAILSSAWVILSLLGLCFKRWALHEGLTGTSLKAPDRPAYLRSVLGPFAGSVLLLLLIAMLPQMLQLQLRGGPRARSVLLNLDGLRIRVEQYAEQHEGRYPASAQALAGHYREDFAGIRNPCTHQAGTAYSLQPAPGAGVYTPLEGGYLIRGYDCQGQPLRARGQEYLLKNSGSE